VLGFGRGARGIGAHADGREPEVAEDALDDGVFFDQRDEAESRAARARALEDVEVEASLHEVGPGVVGASRSGGARSRGLGFGHDPRAPGGVRGEDAVIEDLVGARTRDDRRQSIEELAPGEAQVGGAVGPALLQGEEEVAVRQAL
jgi:hypothetical protein